MPLIETKPKAAASSTADHALTLKLISEFQATWVRYQKEAGVKPVKYSQLSVVALSHLAAVLGVDVGMNSEQFINVCQANFSEAYRRAPKFGK